jgi:hypothetical protein
MPDCLHKHSTHLCIVADPEDKRVKYTVEKCKNCNSIIVSPLNDIFRLTPHDQRVRILGEIADQGFGLEALFCFYKSETVF